MTDFTQVRASLEARGFSVQTFATREEAAAYLDRAIDGKSVGFGGSVTLEELGLYERLHTHNTVYWHWRLPREEALRASVLTDVYCTSLNGLAATGEIVNIDGTGNRVAATLFGHKKVYFIAGRNKLAPTYEEAVRRARNIAAPRNAQRLGCKTPCAVKGDRCYDCKSPQRICRAMLTLWEPTLGTEMEVVLVDEDLGY